MEGNRGRLWALAEAGPKSGYCLAVGGTYEISASCGSLGPGKLQPGSGKGPGGGSSYGFVNPMDILSLDLLMLSSINVL